MAWEEYFNPVSNAVLAEDFNRSQMSSNIDFFGLNRPFPDFKNRKYDIIIVGVGYDATDLSANVNYTPDHVRYWLYRLFKGNYEIQVADLGNFSVQTSIEDVCEKVSRLLAEIIATGTIPIIIGGGKELTYANYLAYSKLGTFCNVLSVSSTLDFKETNDELTPLNYLNKIMSAPDNFLFNYSNIGYQTYFTPPELLELFRSFHFDLHRLGEVRSHIEETEPIIRDVDFVSIDLGAVKYADAPHCSFSTPNGLSSDEICRIARYAGLSPKVKSIGFYGIEPGGKVEWTDHHLMAQAIWHFIEGFYLRKPESLDLNDAQYTKFHVALQGYPDEIIFYKNKVTEKWWMVVPVAEKQQNKYKWKEYIIPCSAKDYDIASNNEIPDRWIKIFHKLNE